MKSVIICFKFCVLISVFINMVRADKACEKEEFEEFYKKIATLLAKRERSGLLILREFKDDRKSVYECGEYYLSKMKEFSANNHTALTEEEKQFIRDEYSLLVSWIVGCETVELWAGDKKGGTIASAIYHFVGGDPKDIIGPETEDDPITHITYPEISSKI